MPLDSLWTSPHLWTWQRYGGGVPIYIFRAIGLIAKSVKNGCGDINYYGRVLIFELGPVRWTHGNVFRTICLISMSFLQEMSVWSGCGEPNYYSKLLITKLNREYVIIFKSGKYWWAYRAYTGRTDTCPLPFSEKAEDNNITIRIHYLN